MNGTEAVVELLGGTRTVGASVRTIADLDAAVRAGLPRTSLDRVVEAAAPASERVWLRNRLVPRATYQRRRKLSPSHSATIERIARVTALANWVWEDEAHSQRFLWTPHPELGGRRPIEAALTELGAREVEEVLQRGLHGLPV
jgi:putative toxin-antitoxin system antitoxin component (TIGR02293 family)